MILQQPIEREQMGIDPDARVALVFGAAHTEKDPGTVWRAFRELPEWTLLVVGTIDDRFRLSPLAKLVASLAIGAFLVFALAEPEPDAARQALHTLVAIVWFAGVCHAFNLLDARGAISVTERAAYIGRIRNLSRLVAQAYYDSREKLGFPLGSSTTTSPSMIAIFMWLR